MKQPLSLRLLLPAATLCCAFAAAESPILFEDVTEKTGLTKHLKGWQFGHAAGWADVNGDGRPDLYAGSYAERPPFTDNPALIPNLLFLNLATGFVLSDDEPVRLQGKRTRTTMPLFADFDNDGDPDLLAVTHARGDGLHPSVLFENTGNGRFRDVTPRSGFWPKPTEFRNASALDIDDDGLLDVVFTDGSYANWGAGTGRLTVLRNRGNWSFEDATERLGFPEKGTAGLGLAVADVNEDGRLDIFVTDSNRLFVSGPDRRYRECETGRFIKPKGSDIHTCGAAFGDLNGDGLLDLVTTEHGEPARLYLYLNKGMQGGIPGFAEVSEHAGLAVPFPEKTSGGAQMKTAHVAICDMDNDGLEDIFLSVLYRDDQGRMQPLVLRNLEKRPVPRFSGPPMDRLVGYYAPGPLVDYDGDGRMEPFLPGWLPDPPTILFRNVTPGGHWVNVRVRGKGQGDNAMGIGATVRVYQPGLMGKKEALLCRRDISIGNGFSSCEEPFAHTGLGKGTECDIEVTWRGQTRSLPRAKADQTIEVVFP